MNKQNNLATVVYGQMAMDIRDLPRTHIYELGANGTVLKHDDTLFTLRKTDNLGENFARIGDISFGVEDFKSMTALEAIYLRENRDVFNKIKQDYANYISSILAKQKPGLQFANITDPVLKFIITEFAENVYRKQGTEKIGRKVYGLLGKEPAAKEDIPVPEPGLHLSEQELLNNLCDIINSKDDAELLKNTYASIQSKSSVLTTDVFKDNLFVVHGVCYKLREVSGPEPTTDILHIKDTNYLFEYASDIIWSELDNKYRQTFANRCSLEAVLNDPVIRKTVENQKYSSEYKLRQIFNNPIREASGESFDFPDSDFGFHKSDKAIDIIGVGGEIYPTETKYVVYIKTQHSAISASDENTKIRKDVFWEIKPMHIGLPIIYSGKWDSSCLPPNRDHCICCIVPHSMHNAFDGHQNYIGVCLYKYRHHPLSKGGELAALKLVLDSHKSLSEGLRAVLYDIKSGIEDGGGPGHHWQKIGGLHAGKLKAQEISLEEARKKNLFIAPVQE